MKSSILPLVAAVWGCAPAPHVAPAVAYSEPPAVAEQGRPPAVAEQGPPPAAAEQGRPPAVAEQGPPPAAVEQGGDDYAQRIAAHAAEHGYRAVALDVGLVRTVDALIEGDLTVERAHGVAVELVGSDELWRAFQVIDGAALYSHPDLPSVLWVERPAWLDRTIVEGSPLRALGGYVEITGARSYDTPVGPRQALVARVAWQEAR